MSAGSEVELRMRRTNQLNQISSSHVKINVSADVCHGDDLQKFYPSDTVLNSRSVSDSQGFRTQHNTHTEPFMRAMAILDLLFDSGTSYKGSGRSSSRCSLSKLLKQFSLQFS